MGNRVPTQRHYFVIFACVVAYLLVLYYNLSSKKAPATALLGMPGVGISLTARYGIVSLREDDGASQDVGRVEGDKEYTEMMERLSSPRTQHASPPYDTMDELWEDWPRQLLRSARKRIGLAASGHVAVLSRMLQHVLDLKASDSRSSLRSNPIVISYPALHGLTQEDITDAAEYLGLSVLSGNHHYQPRNLVAAYAGHRLGLCENYSDLEICRQEGLELPVRQVLLVECTKHTLLLHAKVMREAYELADHDIDISTNFNFGHIEGSRRADTIDRAVQQFLQKRYNNTGLPDRLTAIMMGDKIDQEITDAVERAVVRLGCDVEVIATEPEYIAARGAAELAWRSLERVIPASEL